MIENSKIVNNEIKKVFDEVINSIRNGVILPNGNIKQYDILDFYLNTGLEPKDLFDSVRNIAKKEDIIILKDFLSKNVLGRRINELYLKSIFGIKEEYNTLKDEEGMPIPGTGRILTNEEKKMIFDFIIENKLPLYSKIYKLVLNRYLNGEIELKNDSIKHGKV